MVVCWWPVLTPHTMCCVMQGAALSAAQDKLEAQRQELLNARLDLDRWVRGSCIKHSHHYSLWPAAGQHCMSLSLVFTQPRCKQLAKWLLVWMVSLSAVNAMMHEQQTSWHKQWYQEVWLCNTAG